MSHRILSGRSVLVGSVLALIASGAAAATLEPLTMADIVKVDALGFSCVNEDDLELAFAATGKKDGVVPQSCLPKPCDRQLDAEQLSEFLGRDPTDEKWDDYVARYAEYCVAETGGPWPEDVLFANASDVMDDDDFWSGIAGNQLNSGVGSEIVENVVPTTGGSGTSVGTSTSTTTPPIQVVDISRPNPPFVRPNPPFIRPIRRPVDEEVPLVPLPGSMVLLLGAFGTAWTGRKLSERRAAT